MPRYADGMPAKLANRRLRVLIVLGVILVSTGLIAFSVLAEVTRAAPPPQARTEAEQEQLIEVLGYKITRDRVRVPTDWGETLTKPLKVQTAYNGTDIIFRLRYPSKRAGVIHDFWVYEGGKWVKHGEESVGSVEDGLYEDRITFHVDDGSVRGFANQGCSTTCHADLRDPFMYAAPKPDEVKTNTYYTNVIKKTDTRKYIPDSRNAGTAWWDVQWDQIGEADKDRIATLKANGVFLDQWHWRAARGGPIGYSDDVYVLDYRNADAGRSAFTDNVNPDTKLPAKMFDPAKAGYAAMKWEDIKAGRVSQDDKYYLYADHMKDFDPSYQWQEGDAIPARYLRKPDGSVADITSKSRWTDGWWDIELRRKMDTGNADDKPFKEGRVYHLGFAFYTAATGNRFHYVTFPKTMSLTQLADIRGAKFTGDRPDWNAIPVSEFEAYYPGQTSWQFVTSDRHPGAPAIRADSRSCASCHTEEQLGKLAVGLELRGEREDGRSLTWIAGLIGVFGLAAAGVALRRR